MVRVVRVSSVRALDLLLLVATWLYPADRFNQGEAVLSCRNTKGVSPPQCSAVGLFSRPSVQPGRGGETVKANGRDLYCVRPAAITSTSLLPSLLFLGLFCSEVFFFFCLFFGLLNVTSCMLRVDVHIVTNTEGKWPRMEEYQSHRTTRDKQVIK